MAGTSANFFKANLAQSLSAGGSETTFYLSTIQTLTGETIATADFSIFGKGTITIDPLNSNNLESASFTGVDGTNIALTGGVRGLSAFDYTASTTRAKYHPVGTTCIIAFGVHNLSDLVTYCASLVSGANGNAQVYTNPTPNGLVSLSVAPASPTAPIAIGKNDPIINAGTLSGNAIATSTNPIVDALSLVGEIKMYGGAAAPSGWVLCDGTSYARVGTYASLFGVLSTTYGSVDGSHFNVPDFRGRTALGAGTGVKTFTYASGTTTITATGMTNSSTNEIQTGQAFTFHANGNTTTGLTDNTLYYFIRVAYNQFQAASTLANAQNGTAITTSAGTGGTPTYSVAMTVRSVGDTGGNELHAMSSTELLAHTHTGATYVTNGASNANNGWPNAAAGPTGSTGGNTAMPIMNPFLAISYIIKY